MPDQKKTLKALRCLSNPFDEERDCDNCSYDFCSCVLDVTADALELLKEQEPRVLTLEEVLGGDECWFEYINGYCGHVNAYMEDNKTTTIIYRTNVRPVEVLITDYMKKWRCWSDRPTEEKRKEVKWDADP